MAKNFIRRPSRSTAWGRNLNRFIGTGLPSVLPNDPVLIVITSANPLNMASGQTHQLSVILLDAEGLSIDTTDRQITYSSSSTPVATVSAVGIVTAVSPGSATLTIADIPDSLSTQQSLLVTTPQSSASSVIITPLSVQTIINGNTLLVTARVYDSDGTQLAGQSGTWSSSSTYVSTVSSTGGNPDYTAIVTAVSSSTATCSITFTV